MILVEFVLAISIFKNPQYQLRPFNLVLLTLAPTPMVATVLSKVSTSIAS